MNSKINSNKFENNFEFTNFDELEKESKTSIESKMLEECERIFKTNKTFAIPTKYFKENYKKIFHRNSKNPQPRLNLAMRNLYNANLVELKKVGNKNYIRFVEIKK